MSTRLPTPLTPFVGRAEELAEIHVRLSDPACRLLTLLGPGGMGKTRLALEAASQITFPDGVYTVLLQPLASPELIVPVIADALQFSFLPGNEPKPQLIQYLNGKSLLLLLDNFEHLLAGTELVSDILAQAPGVKILITSRERLHLLEEWVIPVHGLSLPEKLNPHSLEEYSAVQLFLQRARQVQAKFALDTNAPAVYAICQWVQGMPLGLELAASWLRAMSPAQIAAEIQTNLDFLASPLRNMPDRHRSMRAVFDHSWRLLTDQERLVMSKFTVFRGGFTVEAAVVVAAASPQMLASLIDKSLVQVGHNERYDLHPLVRQYAQDQRTPNDATQTAQRHSEYYLNWLAREESAIRDADYAIFMPETDNLWAAWRCAAETGNWSRIQAALNSLFWFYYLQSRFSEGSMALLLVIQLLAEDDPNYRLLRGCLFLMRGNFLKDITLTDAALAAVKTGLSLWEGLEVHKDMGLPLAVATLSLYNTGAPLDLVEETGQRALAIFRAYDEHWGLIYVLNSLSGIELDKGNFAAAHTYVDQAIRLNQERQYLVGLGWAHQQKGLIFDLEGKYLDSLRMHELAIQDHESIGFHTHLSAHYINVGIGKLNLGEVEAACQYIDKSILIADELGNNYLVFLSFLWRAMAAFVSGDDDTMTAYFDRALSLGNPLEDQHLGYLLGMETSVVAVVCERYELTIQLTERYMDGWIGRGFQMLIVTARTIAGFALAATGSDTLAVASLSEALTKAVGVYSPPLMFNALCGIGWLTLASPEKRINLLGFVATHPQYAWLATKGLAKKALATLESNIDAVSFQQALARGASLDLTGAIDLAGEILASAQGRQAFEDALPRHAFPGALTTRELEVLTLIADGLTNAEIAVQLYIGVSTVKRHINHIYDKLDVKNRTQAIARSRQQRLIP